MRALLFTGVKRSVARRAPPVSCTAGFWALWGLPVSSFTPAWADGSRAKAKSVVTVAPCTVSGTVAVSPASSGRPSSTVTVL